jgi:glycosyltransferase involved in cell wall biosynthesis
MSDSDPARPRVLHLCTSDASGGAARAAYRLHDGLRRIGWDSRMGVMRKFSNDPTVEVLMPSAGGLRRAERWWRRHVARPIDNPPGRPPVFATDSFTDDRSGRPGERFGGPLHGRVLHLHWTAGFVDLPTFFDLHLGRSPIVCTMHDMRAFTGGCHYDYGCGRFRAQCGACPQLASADDSDASSRSLARLRRFRTRMLAGGIRFVADSRWIQAEAEASALLSGVKVSTIHYGLDLDTFRPVEPAVARSALGLDPARPVVMFSADSIHIRRKGMEVLVGALRETRIRPQLVTAGHGMVPLPADTPCLSLGAVQNDRLLALAYSAADLFVIPSEQEAFGQTALEAIACGTPVLGSDTGGIPDVVIPGVSGELVAEHTSAAWSKALDRILGNPASVAALRSSCRQFATGNFTLERQANDYAAVYAACAAECRRASPAP